MVKTDKMKNSIKFNIPVKYGLRVLLLIALVEFELRPQRSPLHSAVKIKYSNFKTFSKIIIALVGSSISNYRHYKFNRATCKINMLRLSPVAVVAVVVVVKLPGHLRQLKNVNHTEN